MIFEGAAKEGDELSVDKFEKTLEVFWNYIKVDLSKQKMSILQKELNKLPNYDSTKIHELKKRLSANKNNNVVVV